MPNVIWARPSRKLTKLIACVITVPDAPYWPVYNNSFPSNIVFNATDHALNIHIESDTYRKQGIDIWNNLTTILEADYAEKQPHKSLL